MTIKRKDLIVTAISGLLIVAFCFFGSAERDYTIIHRLCDGCFVTGVLLTGAGMILLCANHGAFNIFGFGARSGLNLILPIFGQGPTKDNGERETYYEYCQRKAERGPKPVSHLLIVGGVYLVLAAILLVIYMVQA